MKESSKTKTTSGCKSDHLNFPISRVKSVDVIGPYCEIMRAVHGTKDVPRQGGEGEQL